MQRATAILWWKGVIRRMSRKKGGSAPWEGCTLLLCLLLKTRESSEDRHRKELRSEVLKTSICAFIQNKSKAGPEMVYEHRHSGSGLEEGCWGCCCCARCHQLFRAKRQSEEAGAAAGGETAA